MKYRIRHVTVHRYATPVLYSQQALRLTPFTTVRQRCLSAAVAVNPQPATRREHVDYFGNGVILLTIDAPHRELTVTAWSAVDVDAPPPPPVDSVPWERVRDGMEAAEIEFACDSPFAAATEPVRAYAEPSFPAGRPVGEAVLDLTRRIHTDFVYDPQATTVGTAPDEVLELRRGVCQDFAHLQIAALRAMGMSARYVGGYLLTRPPTGQPKLIGSDASHAWVSAWIPGYGWFDVDPTNDMAVGDEHIVCAVGRDFEDVSPIKGVVVGGGEHDLSVAVDVIPDEG